MKTEIIDTPLNIIVLGLSGIAAGKDYSGTAFRLMDNMWKIIRTDGFKHKGQNVWVYENGDKVFAGIEPDDPAQQHSALEQKQISLNRYAYYKHIGPYHLIKQSGQMMKEEIRNAGLETGLPYIEIYGHWTNDESKLETELLMAIK